MQEKGNIDLAIRYYLIAIEVCMQFLTNNCSLFCECFMSFFVALFYFYFSFDFRWYGVLGDMMGSFVSFLLHDGYL